MTIPCGETIGHGETCSSGWLCGDCQEKLGLVKQERAAIVAFLRETIFNCTFEDIPSAIEAGEHLK